MDQRGQSNGFQTFFEHWGLLVIIVVAGIAGKVLTFLMGLSGTPWNWLFVASFALIIAGGGLIVYAKLPVYRGGRLLTFGVKSVPQHLLGFYNWGWRVFLFGVVLAFCLLLSKP